MGSADERRNSMVAAAREAALEMHGRSEAAEAKVPPEVRAREEAERQRGEAVAAEGEARRGEVRRPSGPY